MEKSPLQDKLVILTGVGLKPVNHVFKDITTNTPSHTLVSVDGNKYKANIGAATAYELCKAGANVHMLARTEKNLEIVWHNTQKSGMKTTFYRLVN